MLQAGWANPSAHRAAFLSPCPSDSPSCGGKAMVPLAPSALMVQGISPLASLSAATGARRSRCRGRAWLRLPSGTSSSFSLLSARVSLQTCRASSQDQEVRNLLQIFAPVMQYLERSPSVPIPFIDLSSVVPPSGRSSVKAVEPALPVRTVISLIASLPQMREPP